LGGLLHVIAAAFGLSALLATSALAFNVVKYAGAAYLIGLGLRKLMRRPDRGPDQPLPTHGLARVFYEGALVNALNPKTALFFLAFLAQFVVPSRGDVAFQVAVLGGLFLLLAFCTDASWSLLASGAGTWLKRHPRYVTSERYVVGGVYLGLGLATALSGNGRK
jgi:threonine/homoserine/homoserine lactone efflux protein